MALKKKAKTVPKNGASEASLGQERAAKASRKKNTGKTKPKKGQGSSTSATSKIAGTSTRRSKGNSETHLKNHVPEPEGRGGALIKNQQDVDPFEIAKQTMKGSVPAIVSAMVELAKQGSCMHAKTLLEMTGAKHMFDSDADVQESGEPWAKLVLEKLEEAESGSQSSEVSLQEPVMR